MSQLKQILQMEEINKINNELELLSISESLSCSPEQSSSIILTKHGLTSNIKILHMNIRSLNKNFDELVIYLRRIKLDCDFILLTECWLSKVQNSLPSLPGYHSHMSSYKNQNDGVVIYAKDNLNYEILEPQLMESSGLMIKYANTVVVAIYRSPSFKKVEIFLESLNNVLSSLTKDVSVAIIGDININISPGTKDNYAEDYLNLIASHGYLPAHSLPTREQNCLDHVILKSCKNSTTLVLNSLITDHAPLLFAMDTRANHKPSSTATKVNHDQVIKDINDRDFTDIIRLTDGCTAAKKLVNTLCDIIKNNTKIIKIPHRKRHIKPWITDGLLKCIKNRDKLHKQSTKNPDNMIYKTTYTRYRNYCNNLLKKLKTSYEIKELEMAKKNPKATWNIVKRIANLNTTKKSPKELLNISNTVEQSLDTVNTYFANVGRELASKITRNSYRRSDCNLTNPMGNSMVMLEVDECELETVIMGLRNDCAVGWDGIPSTVIKRTRHKLIPILKFIFNLCILHGVFPSVFKKAVVCPVYKSGDRSSVTNYRPISVLTTLSKIFEKLLNKRLENFLHKHNILAPNQFGFRKGVSTEDAVLELTTSIVKKLDSRLKTIGIFLDLSKAFDTVSVPLLLDEMERIGIRGTVLNIFKSYLTDRVQCVKIGSLSSNDTSLQNFGVPQGSVLGPTMFLIYINNLCKLNIPFCNIFTYADDTALLIQGKNWDECYVNAERALGNVMKWLSNNLLTLNLEKTKYITFSLSSTSQPDLSVEYSLKAHICPLVNRTSCLCFSLERTPFIKYLGVYLDCTLSWHKHIDILSGRIRRLMYTFKKIRSSVSGSLLKSVYYALAQSIMTYCISAWGGSFATSILKIERAQRAVIKVMLKKPMLYPTTKLYKEAELLSIRQLFILKVILRQHRHVPINTNALKSRRCKYRICQLVSCRTALAGRQFYILGPRLYNLISKTVEIVHLSQFNCKITVSAFLHKLSYDETENHLKIVT